MLSFDTFSISCLPQAHLFVNVCSVYLHSSVILPNHLSAAISLSHYLNMLLTYIRNLLSFGHYINMFNKIAGPEMFCLYVF